MNNIQKAFDAAFSHWGIILPLETLASQQPGNLSAQGWSVQYQFGQDERGHFLDYYATNRMTNDRHVRIYESGESASLPSSREFIIYPAGATKEDEQKADQEYYEYNRKVGEELKRKGFE